MQTVSRLLGMCVALEIRSILIIKTSPDSITQEMHVWTEVCYLSTILYHHHHNHFRPFSGTIRWAGARRKPLLDFMVLGRITRGRHTNNPGGHHSIRTNQQSTSINPPSLRQLPFLPQPSQFILAWDKHRNMLDCIQYPVAWFSQQYSAMSKTVTGN